MNNVGIVGVGYVGLTQAVGMAQLGHKVVAYDIDKEKIATLKKGKSPFFEPGLEEALSEVIAKGLVSFSNQVADLANSEFIFLCLPTPQDEDGSADTSYLIAAVEELTPVVQVGSYLIVKSTVPVKSWESLSTTVNRKDDFIVSNPEFLREGNALFDFHHPDRIVIGAQSHSSAKKVAELYEDLTTEFVLTDNTSAELIKYAANSFLAMKLSFVNDISALCETLDANSPEVLFGVGLDNRIGNKFLTPGPGWGGSCFPKDVRALANIADKEKIMMPLLTAAIESNENAQDRVVAKILKNFDNNLNGIKIAALGLAFKANTDDVRNSPAIGIIYKLQRMGANIIAYDPAVKKSYDIELSDSVKDLIYISDLILVLTEWSEFKNIDPIPSSEIKDPKYIYDTRGFLDLKQWKSQGYKII